MAVKKNSSAEPSLTTSCHLPRVVDAQQMPPFASILTPLHATRLHHIFLCKPLRPLLRMMHISLRLLNKLSRNLHFNRTLQLGMIQQRPQTHHDLLNRNVMMPPTAQHPPRHSPRPRIHIRMVNPRREPQRGRLGRIFLGEVQVELEGASLVSRVFEALQ